MAPRLALPPSVPSTVQVTAVLSVPVTVAVSVTGVSGGKVVWVGVTVIWTWFDGLAGLVGLAGVDGVPAPPPPQPVAVASIPATARIEADAMNLLAQDR
jgi:hypothetical protein